VSRSAGRLIDALHFRRAAAASRWFRRKRWRDGGLGSQVFGHEVGMLAKAVARALDLDDDGMVQQAVEKGCRDNGIAKDLAPFGKAAV
jgi:hypothetical protein